ANNPIWLIRNGELQSFGPDKQPIGTHGAEHKPFSLHEMQLEKGDCLYLFTDGYADQFGGPKGKKFKYKQLQELLLTIHRQSAGEQKRITGEHIERWKGNLEQVDDILLIGIKI
ncbi:MAG: protein serine/threonine phosphatase, partial [Bacteroidetes bacterium]